MTDSQCLWVVPMVNAFMAEHQVELANAMKATSSNIVVTFLNEPADSATPEEREKWERTCDNCGRYCPDDEQFYSAMALRPLLNGRVEITFGSCLGCVKK